MEMEVTWMKGFPDPVRRFDTMVHTNFDRGPCPTDDLLVQSDEGEDIR